jgi:two-component system, LytTR family, sensor kinase
MNIFNYINRRIFLHILFWLISGIILIVVVLNLSQSMPYVWERFILSLLSQIIMIVIGIKYLIPTFLLEKKYKEFTFYSLIIVVVISLIINLIEAEVLQLPDIHDRFKDDEPDNFDFIPHIFPHSIALIVASLGEALHYANMRMQESARLKSEKLETEMKFLKSQINPHFLFNALNNVYTLAIIKAEETPDIILQLSDMLRYMLYDCKEDFVPLYKELDYIRNFIALYQLKEEEPLNITVDFSDENPDILIPPMLFIPFIENSFKHSKIEDLEKNWVKISLKIEDTLVFRIQNTIPVVPFTKDKVGGIGLGNIKRRLELIYGEEYKLFIHDENAIFDVKLELNLGKSWTTKKSDVS